MTYVSCLPSDELQHKKYEETSALVVQRFWWKTAAWTTAVFSVVCFGLLLHTRRLFERLRKLHLENVRLQNQDTRHKRREMPR